MARETAVDLYLITRKDSPGYDESAGFVVAAVTFTEARKTAAGQAGDEGKAIWMDVSRSRCEKLATDVKRPGGVVLRDFNNS